MTTKRFEDRTPILAIKLQTNLVLHNIIPGLATQCIADYELEDIKREIGDNAVDPDNSCPSPSNTCDSGKAPATIHSNDGSHLNNISKYQH